MQPTTTNTSHSREQVRQNIAVLLEDFFSSRVAESSAMSSQYGQLWQTMADLSRSGGKRLRPYMVVLAYRSFGGQDPHSIMPVAAAWELLHMCMLIHDDIIDNDFVRYGVDNVAGSYRTIYGQIGVDEPRRTHYATGAALLAGDLALSGAHELVLESNLPAAQQLLAVRGLTAATFIVAGGELLDTEAALFPMDAADPMLIAQLKTASYSFVGPLTAGATLAGASDAALKQLQLFGEAIGYAFQLVDDMIGVFGNSELTGKSTTGDLSEGKRTYLMQQAFALSSDEDREQLHVLLGKPDVSETEVEILRDIITRSGARTQTEELVKQYAEQGRKIVQDLDISEDSRQELIELITLTTVRQF